MILVLDNYDSFVFNLARYLQELGHQVTTYRNDGISLEDIARLAPDAILLSPGPGRPGEAGIMLEVIRHFSGPIPILGICLGHQAIGEAFGAEITRADEPMHGRAGLINHDGSGCFHDLPTPLQVGRYHSLIVDPDGLPPCLRVTAHSKQGEIMGLAHKHHPTMGLQFHPESILTTHGHQLLANFLKACHVH